MAPDYLCDLLSIDNLSMSLRSSNHTMLTFPVSRLKLYGDTGFCVAGPTLWNILPADIRDALLCS